MSRRWIIVCGLAFVSCGSSPPQPPVVGGSGGTETVNGSERLGWDQTAADAAELATFGYAVYVDGTRTEATAVTCAPAPAAAGFPCSARLPSMPPGSHTLELASYTNDGGTLLESARSSPLRVTMAAQITSIGNAPALRNGSALRGDLLAGVIGPTDLAFAADGRIFIAERAGRIRVVRDGRLVEQPAISLTDEIGPEGELLAIALDPQFDRTHYVFVIYTAPDRTGAPAFTLARFREVSDTFGDRAILLDSAPPSSRPPAAALRFGPDGKLYAAYDDGGDPRLAQDAASLNGKVLRLNVDGTTPTDARGATPIYAGGYRSPVAIDWDPSTSTMWVADEASGGSSFVFYRGALFPEWAGRLLGASTLFSDAAADGVTRVATGRDGAVYYLTAGALGRVAPDRTP